MITDPFAGLPPSRLIVRVLIEERSLIFGLVVILDHGLQLSRVIQRNEEEEEVSEKE